MKKIFLVLVVVMAFGCTSKSDMAQQSAQNFLDAFLANDYSGAAGYCSEDFQADFQKIIEDFQNLDEPTRNILKEQCSLYKAQIEGVERVNESDTFKVNYKIVHISPDNSSFEQEVAAQNTLRILDGKVIMLN